MPEKVEEFKMITTRRSIGDSMVSEQRSVSGGIGLLERRAEAPAEDIFTSIPTANAAPVTSYAATSAAAAPAPAAPAYSAPEEDVYELAPEKEETDEEARLRMQRNLNRLLNGRLSGKILFSFPMHFPEPNTKNVIYGRQKASAKRLTVAKTANCM